MGADFTRGTPSPSRYDARRARGGRGARGFQRFVKDSLSTRGTVDWRVGRRAVQREVEVFARRCRSRRTRSSGSPKTACGGRDGDAGARAAAPRQVVSAPQARRRLDRRAQRDRERDARAHRQRARESRLAACRQRKGECRDAHESAARQADRVARLLSEPAGDPDAGVHARRVRCGGGGVRAAAQSESRDVLLGDADPRGMDRRSVRIRSSASTTAYKMLDLTMHEGIPGHVVQGAYANLLDARLAQTAALGVSRTRRTSKAGRCTRST